MWNYSFILPNFVILTIFLVYYFVRPRLPIKLNKIFLCLLAIDLSVITIDVLASRALEHAELFSPFVLRALNALFFAAFIARIFLFFAFTKSVFGQRRKTQFLPFAVENGFFIVSEIFAILNLFTDTIFSIGADGTYATARFYLVIYFCAFYYICLSIAVICVRKKTPYHGSAIPALCFNIVLFLGYIARFLFPQYLIMNFFSLLAIIIIFISYENPLLYLAGKTRAFNKRALFAGFSELRDEKSPLVLGFVIHNYNELREVYSGVQMDRGISLITQFLQKNYPSLLRFYLHDGRFVLIGRDNTQLDSIRERITARFARPWQAGSDVDLYLEAKFVQLAPSVAISMDNSEKVINAIFAAFRDVDKREAANIIVDEATLTIIEQSVQIKRAVESAIENNSVEMFLQPLMRVEDYKLVGAEALARIRDENGELIPPGLFIPIAEKNGRINSMGEQMFERACEFIHTHDIEKMGISWINVNLSPIQFLRPDLSKRFGQILEKYTIDAEKIHLEITEESMIDYALLQKQIQTMRNSGFQFVLDDYGSGYSNVSRLKRCPFINIKLDMEIVRDYFKERDKILPGLVQAFKQMHFTVTAEGVETLEMVEAMKHIGCDFLQGYYFSKPLPVEEFAKKYGK